MEEESLEEEKNKYKYLLLGLMKIEESKLAEIKSYIRYIESQETLEGLKEYLQNIDLKKRLRTMMSRDCHRRYMMEEKFKIVTVLRRCHSIQNIIINREDKYVTPYVDAVCALLNDDAYMSAVLSAKNTNINVNDHDIIIHRQGDEKEMQWLTILSIEFVNKQETKKKRTSTKPPIKKAASKRTATRKGEKKDDTPRTAKAKSKRTE